jgi:hypothetical protein
VSFFWKYVVSIAIGAVLIWLAFRGEDWSGFGDRLRSVDVGMVGLYLGLFAFAHSIRIVRWGVLVRALGPIRWRDIVSAGSVGYMCIIVFPLRLGELVRPYLVRGKGGVTASGALATVVVERVIDGLLFVGLFFVFLAMLPPSDNPAVAAVRASAYLAGAVFVSALVVLVAAYYRRQTTVAIVRNLGEKVHVGLTAKVVTLLTAFLDGLKVLPDRRRLVAFFAMTVVYWALLGVGMKLMAVATHIPDLTYTGGFALLAVLVVGIMIPAGPGFTGTFELALKGGFALLVLAPESQANIALYTVMLHVTQLLVQVVFGAAFLLTGQVDMREAVSAEL